jgi:hypothetical protein
MAGTNISFIFSEQLRLIFQTTPLENQLAGAPIEYFPLTQAPSRTRLMSWVHL